MRLSLALVVMASVAAGLSSPQEAAADTIAYEKVLLRPAKVRYCGGQAHSAPIDKIAATERVDGIYPALLPEARRKSAEEAGNRYIQVFTSANDARDFSVDGTYNKPLDATANVKSCISSRGGATSSRISFYLRTKPYPPAVDRPGSPRNRSQPARMPMPKPKPAPASKGPPKPEPDTLRPIHGERMTVDGDSVTIDTFESMIDLNTLGVRRRILQGVDEARESRVWPGRHRDLRRSRRSDKRRDPVRRDAPGAPQAAVRRSEAGFHGESGLHRRRSDRRAAVGVGRGQRLRVRELHDDDEAGRRPDGDGTRDGVPGARAESRGTAGRARREDGCKVRRRRAPVRRR